MGLLNSPKLKMFRLLDLFFRNSTRLLALKTFKKILGFRSIGAIQLDKSFISREWNNLDLEQVQLFPPEYYELKDEAGLIYSIKSFSSIYEYRLGNAIVDTTSGAIFENKSNPRAFLESAPFTIETLSELVRPRPSRLRIKGEVAVLSNRSYWHWLIDDLPRFLAVIKRAPDINVLVHPNPRSYVRDALKMVNPSEITYKSVALPETVRFINVGNVESFPSLRDLSALREFAESYNKYSTGNEGIKVFISRRFAPSRNARELYYEGLALQSGFQVIYCENISLQKQIEVFSNSSVVVAANGAALANTVWCQQPANIYEIYDHDWESDCVRDLCSLLKLNYSKVHYSLAKELFESLR